MSIHTGGIQPSPDNFYGRRDILLERLANQPDDWPYDFLHPHQLNAVESFCKEGYAIVNGDIPNEGMAIDHATGTGKTRTLAAILRRIVDPSMSAVLFTPNTIIRDQIATQADSSRSTSSQDEAKLSDFEQYLPPGVKINEYTTQRQYVGKGLVGMNYQALASARRKGNFQFIDPAILLCDEGHHLDAFNTWRGHVQSVMPGRLAVRTTATSEFRDDETRSSGDLFPIKLGKRFKLREGISRGVLSEVYGFLYDSKVRIRLPNSRSGSEDYSEDAVYEAVVNSPVNDMAVKICVQEISQGRQGIIQCMPGHDRAHSQIMAGLLSEMKVRRPSGDRMKIRVAHVDGDMPKKEVFRIFKEYEAGRIDVLTHTSLIEEGFNSIATDFLILIAPTASRGKVEQPIGRAVRFREDKIATIHGFAYAIEGDDRPQVTIEDILGSERSANGVLYYGAKTLRSRDAAAPRNRGKSFNLDKYNLDPLLLERRIRERIDKPKEMRITRGGASKHIVSEEVSQSDFQGRTVFAFARQFHSTPEQVSEIFANAGVTSSKQKVKSGEVTIFDEDMGFSVLVEKLSAKPLAERTDELTVSELLAEYQKIVPGVRFTGQSIEAVFQKHGTKPVLFVSDKEIVVTYPRSAANLPLLGKTNKRVQFMLTESSKVSQYEGVDLVPEVAVVRWVDNLLERNTRQMSSSDIALGMRFLALAIKDTLPTESPYKVEDIRVAVQHTKLKPSANMILVMRKMNNISFQSLLYAANKAYAHYAILKDNQAK